MLFMVIENFRNGDAVAVGKRFKQSGRMLPEGAAYQASWIDSLGKRCGDFQGPLLAFLAHHASQTEGQTAQNRRGPMPLAGHPPPNGRKLRSWAAFLRRIGPR